MLIGNIFVHLLHLLSLLGIPLAWVNWLASHTFYRAVPVSSVTRSGKGAGSPLQTKIRVRKPWKILEALEAARKVAWDGLAWTILDSSGCLKDMNGYEWI